MTEISGKVLRDAIISGAHRIQNQRSQVDELNVFPVPDGDTGTNMGMTIGAAAKELKQLSDTVTVEKTASVAASAMLRGARGNSGVILSLLFRGFSKALVGKKTMSTEDIKIAVTSGVKAAYKAVMKPTEGTMLTVARVAGEHIDTLDTDNVQDMFVELCTAAKDALDKTPEQLPVLKKAGVVDAGGMGLWIIFENMRDVVCGKPIEELMSENKKPTTSSAGKGVFFDDLDGEDSDFGYCTEFLVNKSDSASHEKLRAFLESLGDSVVVVDDEEIIKCHVHTDDPGKALSQAIEHGALTSIKIENMSEQFEVRRKQGRGLQKQALSEKEEGNTVFGYKAVDPDREYGFVAIAAGEGLKNLFLELGVDAVVSGGQTMNPSTDDILSAAHSVGAKNVFILPNNKNIILAAEQAKKLADRNLIVLPTRTLPQGISAMLSFDEGSNPEENAIAMNAAADSVITGSVTFAARDSNFDGHNIKKGEILALENSRLAFTGHDLKLSVQKLAKHMLNKNSSFLTVIAGEDVTEEDAQLTFDALCERLPDGIEANLIMGGQPVYYYILSVE